MSVIHLFVVLVLVVLFLFVVVTVWNSSKCTQTSTTTQHEIVSFVCSIQNVGERRPEESLEMNMERFQPQLSYKPLFPTPRQVQWRLLLGSLFNSAPWPYVCYTCLLFSMNWLNHVLSLREGVLNRNLTLDTTANRCQRVLLLVWPPTDSILQSCQTWKFRYAQICQVKNLHDGRGPSKVLKSCHLALFIADELVEDPMFLFDAENPITP